jgi:hypothetical protein
MFATPVDGIVGTGLDDAFKGIAQINRIVASGEQNPFRHQRTRSAAPDADF